jgi:hypothetical protein
MIPMTRANAEAIVKQLLESRERDVRSLQNRIDDLEEEYRHDPYEGTEAQIKRLKLRIIHYRLEAEALEIVLK